MQSKKISKDFLKDMPLKVTSEWISRVNRLYGSVEKKVALGRVESTSKGSSLRSCGWVQIISLESILFFHLGKFYGELTFPLNSISEIQNSCFLIINIY